MEQKCWVCRLNRPTLSNASSSRTILFFPGGDGKRLFWLTRFAGVKEVASFASLPQSFESMMYIVMFSNWTMFMDAAGQVGSPVVAKIFFYSFKIIGFYFLFPVSLYC